jgi:hypothetical protein
MNCNQCDLLYGTIPEFIVFAGENEYFNHDFWSSDRESNSLLPEHEILNCDIRCLLLG